MNDILKKITVRPEYFLIALPLFFIRGYTNNNYFLGAYILLLLLFVIFDHFLKEKFAFKFHEIFPWLFLLYWGVYITLKSTDASLAFKYLVITIIIPFFLFQLVGNIKFTENLFDKIFASLFIAGFVLGIGSIIYVINVGYNPNDRLTSFWEQWNIVAGFFMIAFMFNLSFIINRSKGQKIFFYFVTIFVIMFGMFLTQTRGVWLATMVAVCLYFIKRPKVIVPVLIFVGFFGLFFLSTIQSRILTAIYFTQDGSSIGRIQAWVSTLILIKNNLFLGYGFESYLSLRDTVFDYYLVKVVHSHNTYLRAVLELGLIGAIAYFYFFFKAAIKSFTYKKEIRDKYKKYIDGFQLTFLGLLIIFNFEPYFSLYDNSCIAIWLVIALSFSFKISVDSIESTGKAITH